MSELDSIAKITPDLLRKVADTCNIIKTNSREMTHNEIFEILIEFL